MKKKIRKLVYLFLSFLHFILLVFVCIIKPIPHSLMSFLLIIFIPFTCIIWYIFYRKTKNSIFLDETSKKIRELSEEYSQEKKMVDYVSRLIYDDFIEKANDDIIIFIDCDESYFLDFFDNLNRFANSKKKDIYDVTTVQKNACLIDALCGIDAWVLKTVCENADNVIMQLNIELATKVGLLLCGHTLEEIDTKKTYLENMMIVLREAVKDEKDGELVFINIMSELLLNF